MDTFKNCRLFRKTTAMNDKRIIFRGLNLKYSPGVFVAKKLPLGTRVAIFRDFLENLGILSFSCDKM